MASFPATESLNQSGF